MPLLVEEVSLDVHLVVAEIKHQERFIRAWKRWTPMHQRALAKGVDEAELPPPPRKLDAYRRCDPKLAHVLYTLRAHFRGRVHRHDGTLEAQEEFLRACLRDWERYARRSPTSTHVGKAA